MNAFVRHLFHQGVRVLGRRSRIAAAAGERSEGAWSGDRAQAVAHAPAAEEPEELAAGKGRGLLLKKSPAGVLSAHEVFLLACASRSGLNN